MKFSFFLLLLTVVLFTSCNDNSRNNLSQFLNKEQLGSQIFSVDINADTTLLTKSGCIIKLPKGTLQSEQRNVKLEIKEALNISNIVLGGLRTMSGNQSLSSGGMIYINAAQGYKIEIKKEVEILVPTKKYNPSMQVFKGDEKANGKIDWTDPTALPNDETITKINNGDQLFKANCASCHKIFDDFTGPRLYGITERRPKKWLYDFTRNPARRISDKYNNVIRKAPTTDSTKADVQDMDFYSQCLYNKWKGNGLMSSFPQLSDMDLDALYSFIKAESEKKSLPEEKIGKTCCDSCDIYYKALAAAHVEFSDFSESGEAFFNYERTIPVPTIVDSFKPQTDAGIDQPFTKITPTSVRATYYTINIKTFGWYNIDALMKDYSNCVPSELFVRIQGSFKVEVNIVLIIPSVKAFVEGGKLNDGKQYGFDEIDGRIPLPQQAQCFVMGFAEYRDKIIFGKTAFTAQQKQTIEVTMAETTKELMRAQIKQMDLNDIELEIKKPVAAVKPLDQRKNAAYIKKMEEADKLRPKDCACGLAQ